jgi:gas vesicle protein
MARDEGNGFAWFLAGLGLGAVIGVLYAPKSGSETRREIVERAGQSKEYVTRTARTARDQAGQWVERGRQIFEDQKENLASAVEAGRQAYRDATGTTPRAGESGYSSTQGV